MDKSYRDKVLKINAPLWKQALDKVVSLFKPISSNSPAGKAAAHKIEEIKQEILDYVATQKRGKGIPTEALGDTSQPGEIAGGGKSPKQVLEKHGLTVEHVPTYDPWKEESGEHWTISGKTAENRGIIEKVLVEMGHEDTEDNPIKNQFDRKNNQWRSDYGDPTIPLARELSGDNFSESKGVSKKGTRGESRRRTQRDKGVDRDIGKKLARRTTHHGRTGRHLRGLVTNQTQKLIRLGEKFLSPKVIEEQIEDIGSIKQAYLDNEETPGSKRAFVVASDAGTGKTFVIGGAIKELIDAGVKLSDILYVTERDDLERQIMKDDLPAYGLEGLKFQTYGTLHKSVASIDENTVVIFDECHNLKNYSGKEASKRGKAGQEIMSRAKFCLCASATPWENPVEAGYLDATGIFTSEELGHEGHIDWAIQFGADVQRHGDDIKFVFWPRGGEKVQEQIDAREDLINKGIFTRREKSLKGLAETELVKMDVSPEYVKLVKEVEAAYDVAIARAKGNSKRYGNASLMSMEKVTVVKRILETAKTEEAIKRTDSLLAEGKQVVIFTETVNPKKLGSYKRTEKAREFLTKRLIKEGMTEEEKSAALRERDRSFTYDEMQTELREWNKKYGKMKTAPAPFSPGSRNAALALKEAGVVQSVDSIIDLFVAHYKDTGYKIATYTADQTIEEVQKWKDNKADVLLSTMKKGGTGLSLHDTTGDMPARAQIAINLPWTATGADQVSSRLARYGTKKLVLIEWLFAGNVPKEVDISRIIGGKMRDMGASIRGVDWGVAEEIKNFDFTAPSERTDDKEAREMYELAEAEEANRSPGEDEFSTPYPTAVYMQRVAGVRAGDSVLEPSSGPGGLIKFLPEGVDVTAVEIDGVSAEDLARNNIHARVMNADFLKLGAEAQNFDVVLMNPPFSQESSAPEGAGAEPIPQDIVHVQAAFKRLDTDGRLVAIMNEASFNLEDDQGFAEWLDKVGATVIQLPESVSTRIGADIPSRLVVIDNNGESGLVIKNLSNAKYDSLLDMEDAVPARKYVNERLLESQDDGISDEVYEAFHRDPESLPKEVTDQIVRKLKEGEPLSRREMMIRATTGDLIDSQLPETTVPTGKNAADPAPEEVSAEEPIRVRLAKGAIERIQYMYMPESEAGESPELTSLRRAHEEMRVTSKYIEASREVWETALEFFDDEQMERDIDLAIDEAWQKRGGSVTPAQEEFTRKSVTKSYAAMRKAIEKQLAKTPAPVAEAAVEAPVTEVGPTGVTDKVSQFHGKERGESVTFNFTRNTKPAPDMGGRFGQDVEPAGRYLMEASGAVLSAEIPGQERGELTLRNPLYIDFGSGYGEPGNWKQVLSDRWGVSGAELSKRLVDAGHDGIVVVEPNGYTSEIVDLTSFRQPTPAPADPAPKKGFKAKPTAAAKLTEATPVFSQPQYKGMELEGKPLEADIWDDVSTGTPVQVEGYRGTGRKDKKSAYAVGAAGPALGEGRYYAITQKQAKEFGPKVEKGLIRLENPYVIKSDADLLELSGGNELPMTTVGWNAVLPNIRAELLRRGHDGAIVNVLQYADFDEARGIESTKRLREVFGTSQVVDFEVIEGPESVSFAAGAAGRVKSFMEKKKSATYQNTGISPDSHYAWQHPTKKVDALLGSETEIDDGEGNKLPARYALVELGDIISSYDWSEGQPVDRRRSTYPDNGLDTTNYIGDAGKAKRDRVVNYRETRTADDFVNHNDGAGAGPIIINAHGVVISGQENVSVLQLATHQGNYDWMREKLDREKDQYGLQSVKVMGDVDVDLENPVLVRVMDVKSYSDPMTDHAKYWPVDGH